MSKEGRRSKVRRSALIGSLAATAALALSGPAYAGEGWKTTIVFDDAINVEGDVWKMRGHVESAREKCMVNRRVKMFKRESGSWKHVNTDRTNRAGRWSIKGSLPGQPPLKFTVTPRTLANGEVCRKDSIKPFSGG
jgi:hypothetical protein